VTADDIFPVLRDMFPDARVAVEVDQLNTLLIAWVGLREKHWCQVTVVVADGQPTRMHIEQFKHAGLVHDKKYPTITVSSVGDLIGALSSCLSEPWWPEAAPWWWSTAPHMEYLAELEAAYLDLYPLEFRAPVMRIDRDLSRHGPGLYKYRGRWWVHLQRPGDPHNSVAEIFAAPGLPKTTRADPGRHIEHNVEVIARHELRESHSPVTRLEGWDG